MSPGIQAINLGRAAAADIYGTIHRTPAIDISTVEGKELGDDYDGSIELCNVFFAYPSRPSDYIFEGFNLSIPSGSSVALVGVRTIMIFVIFLTQLSSSHIHKIIDPTHIIQPSGSGKSTISKLLLRLYDPNGGHVRVGADRVSLRDLNLQSWRSQIGYVPQEPSLFPGTIRDNIARGKPTPATEDEIVEAAKAACAHEFISELADGYDTFYSGASLQISGGQAQRIAIARAIIRNPKILVLDEATR
jgi:ATP-binding cassette, subfamily B (MDR/TAP), member 1